MLLFLFLLPIKLQVLFLPLTLLLNMHVPVARAVLSLSSICILFLGRLFYLLLLLSFSRDYCKLLNVVKLHLSVWR